MNDNDNDYANIIGREEAAQVLGISMATVDRWRKAGKVSHMRRDTAVYWKPQLVAIAAGEEVPPAPKVYTLDELQERTGLTKNALVYTGKGEVVGKGVGRLRVILEADFLRWVNTRAKNPLDDKILTADGKNVLIGTLSQKKRPFKSTHMKHARRWAKEAWGNKGDECRYKVGHKLLPDGRVVTRKVSFKCRWASTDKGLTKLDANGKALID